MQAKTDSLESKAVESLGVKEDENRENSYTWVYIVVLAVLVIIVAWLVSFASKVMKQRNDEQPARDPEDAPGQESSGASRELREKFAATLAAKNADIKSLTAKNESLLRENESVKRDMEALVAETGSLRTRLTEANRRVSELEGAMAALAAQAESAKAAAAAATPAPAAAPVQPSVAPAPRAVAETQRQSVEAQRPAASAATPRIIYLGRANMKGIFVRADRQMNVGNSVFALETSDGYSGTFRVVSDPTVWELALMTPVESLAGACVGHDLENTADFSSIVTDSPGTAIFEDGCWKVIRKAKIHYA